MVQANKEYIRLKQNEIIDALANNLEYTKNNSDIRYKINKEKDLDYIEIDGVSMYKIKNKKLFNEIRKLYATGPTHKVYRYRIQVKYIMKNGSVKTEQTLIY